MAAKAQLRLVSGGNILPSRFVKLSTVADHTCLQAGANETPIGISQVGTKYAPGTAADNTYAAEAGDNIEVYGEGDECMLFAGSGGWTRGDFLKSDATGGGQAVLASGATAQEIGAQALESNAAGQLGRVWVTIQRKTYPALS